MDSYTAKQLIILDESFQDSLTEANDVDYVARTVLKLLDLLDNTVDNRIIKFLDYLRDELQLMDAVIPESEWLSRIRILYTEFQDFISLIGPLASEKTIRDYAHLWMNERKRYVLYRDDKDINNLEKYLVYDTQDKEFILIDDPLVQYEIIYQMRKAGILETAEV